MTSLVSTILQLALALLMSAQTSTAAPTTQRQQAITVATQAIQLSERAISATGASTLLANPAPVPAPSSVTINQPTANANWAMGHTVPIQWSASVPWNSSGMATSVAPSSFTLTLWPIPPGSNAPFFIASGTQAQLVTNKGDVYSQFSYNFTVPNNIGSGQYALNILQSSDGSTAQSNQTVTVMSQ